MQHYEIIAQLEADNSRLTKQAILLAAAERNDVEFFEGCQLALNALVTFGVKQVPFSDADGPGLRFEDFRNRIEALIQRKTTGNAARNLIEQLKSSATVDEWNGWYRRILIKDLRCGVSEKTVNAVVAKRWPQLAVPVFSCQLAQDAVTNERKLTGRKLVEVKLDGTRMLTIVYPNATIVQYSRNGKELVNFTTIADQFKELAHTLSEPWVFDGEVMSSSFQDLMKQLYRKTSVDTSDATYWVFDALPLNQFLAGVSTQSQSQRSAHLIELHSKMSERAQSIVKLVGQTLVDLDTRDGIREFEELNRAAIDGGYEGLMLKDPDAAYECRRSFSWLKIKPYIEVSLCVDALEEGTGRNIGRLGAMLCSGTDSVGGVDRFISVSVGSGLSDAQRIEFWANQQEVVGQIVEVRADAVTQNSDGTFSLRFPRFIRFRSIEAGQKI